MPPSACRTRGAGDDVVVLGVSQGGHAALFAGELAAGYAPDLDLRGVVALAPGAELAQAALLLANDPTAVGFAVAIGAGFEAAYPEARLEDVLTARAMRSIDVVDERCIGRVLEEFARPADEVLRLDRILAPPWPALLDENTPGRQRTAAPVFVGQGTADRARGPAADRPPRRAPVPDGRHRHLPSLRGREPRRDRGRRR